MVNLNAQRNLPPDSTPWGKALERRLSALERENSLLKSDIKNASGGLNSLTTRLGSLRIFSANSGFSGAYPSEPWDPNEFHDVDSEWEIVGDPAIGYSSSGRLVCLKLTVRSIVLVTWPIALEPVGSSLPKQQTLAAITVLWGRSQYTIGQVRKEVPYRGHL